MSELSLVKKDTGDAEGLHVAQADFTCWQYGIKTDKWTYAIEPIWQAFSGTIGFYSNGMQFYREVTWTNGIIIFSSPFTPNYGNSGYFTYSNGGNTIWQGSRDWGDGSSNYGFLTVSTRLLNAIAPGTTYKGHAYSKDPAKYPADGIADDGLYYIKKTGTTFDKKYW